MKATTTRKTPRPTRTESMPSPHEGYEFGPNTELVADLLLRLDGLTAEQAARLNRRWASADRAERARAHAAVKDAVREARREDPAAHAQVQLAQDRLLAWTSEVPTARSWIGRVSGVQLAREAAAPPIADAIAALVLADVLDRADARVLYAPWAEVIGAPKLPTYADDDPE
jgi:hypothetical protein